MSYAAIYDVTRALRTLLHNQLVSLGLSGVVTLLPPGDTLPSASGLNLYLYRVTESPFSHNQSWPGDRTTPPSDRPALGLQLYYLLTPLGTNLSETTFTPTGDDAHTMLGVAMLTLQENPVLNDIHRPGFDADLVLPDYLLNSYEKIRIALASTTLEELSKIWATINQPYRLSVAYEVALVELTPTAPPPAGGIVLTAGVSVVTLDAPRLVGLSPVSGALAKIVAGSVVANTVQVQGFGLSFPGQSPIVRVGGQPVPIVGPIPPPGSGLQSMSISLPTDLPAGPAEDVSVTLNGRTSVPIGFTVSPWLSTLTPIRTDLSTPGQKVVLQGSGFTTTPQSVVFHDATTTVSVGCDPGALDTRVAATVPTALANGLYEVRLVVDGAGTCSNARSFEVFPRLDSPIGLAVVVPAGTPVHQITLDGARLDGGDVRLIIDEVIFQIGPNANASQIVFTLGRLLDPGSHAVAVNVDGHLSHAVEVTV